MKESTAANPTIGQHFLINPGLLNKIAALIPKNSDVIELGAGQGQLTEKLVKSAKNIVAVEIDERFFESLDGLTRPFPKLKIHIGDILKFDFNYYSLPWIVGNIPYHITEPLLHKLAKYQISGCILLVGDKFAYEATVTNSQSPYFGKLSLLTNTFFIPEIITMVDRTEFDPQPRTKSALLKLVPRPKGDYQNKSLFLLRSLFLTAKHGPLVKNVIAQGFESLSTEVLTKNQARKLVMDLNLSEKILNTQFEQLNNQQYQEIAQKLDIFSSV